MGWAAWTCLRVLCSGGGGGCALLLLMCYLLTSSHGRVTGARAYLVYVRMAAQRAGGRAVMPLCLLVSVLACLTW